MPIASAADARKLALGLAQARMAIGTVAFVAPVTSLRLLGSDTGTARRVTWLTRVTAVRDTVLGAGAVARRGEASWVVGGALADAADAAVMLSALRAGRLRGVVPTVVALGAAGAAVAGVGAAVLMRRG